MIRFTLDARRCTGTVQSVTRGQGRRRMHARPSLTDEIAVAIHVSHYNEVRPHSSLDYLTRRQFKAKHDTEISTARGEMNGRGRQGERPLPNARGGI